MHQRTFIELPSFLRVLLLSMVGISAVWSAQRLLERGVRNLVSVKYGQWANSSSLRLGVNLLDSACHWRKAQPGTLEVQSPTISPGSQLKQSWPPWIEIFVTPDNPMSDLECVRRANVAGDLELFWGGYRRYVLSGPSAAIRTWSQIDHLGEFFAARAQYYRRNATQAHTVELFVGLAESVDELREIANGRTYLNLCQYHLGRREWHEAQRYAEKAIRWSQGDRERAEGWHYLGRVFFDSQRLNRAEECFRSALPISAVPADQLYWLGRIQELEGNWIESEALYLAALERDPSHRFAAVALSRVRTMSR